MGRHLASARSRTDLRLAVKSPDSPRSVDTPSPGIARAEKAAAVVAPGPLRGSPRKACPPASTGSAAIRHFINGSYVASASTRTFEKRSPLSNQLLTRVDEGGHAEIDAAVAGARMGWGDWGRMATDQRVAMLHAVVEEITRRFAMTSLRPRGRHRPAASCDRACLGAARCRHFKIFADIVKNVPLNVDR